MNFVHLRYFLKVAEELNITRAAEELHLSQQALSNHIAKLEKELNVKLFSRTPKLSLSHAGRLLVDTSYEILKLEQEFLSKVGDINKQHAGSLRIGVSYTCGMVVLPQLLPQFNQEFPRVDFSIFEGSSTQLEEQLSHKRTDIILSITPVFLQNVEIIPLVNINLVVVIPTRFVDEVYGEQAAHIRTLARQGEEVEIEMEGFAGHPFVLLKKGNRGHHMVSEYLDDFNFKPNVVAETESTLTALALAQSEAGIFVAIDLFMPHYFENCRRFELENVDVFPIKDKRSSRQLAIAYDKNRYLSQYERRFIEIVSEIFEQKNYDQLAQISGQ